VAWVSGNLGRKWVLNIVFWLFGTPPVAGGGRRLPAGSSTVRHNETLIVQPGGYIGGLCLGRVDIIGLGHETFVVMGRLLYVCGTINLNTYNYGIQFKSYKVEKLGKFQNVVQGK
jgi:hypothetical protein